MARNIIKKRKKDKVIVYGRSQHAVDSIIDEGAESASSIGDLCEKADVIITMVPTSIDVEEVYSQLLPNLKPGKVTIEMSTIEPSISIELSRKVAATGATMLDCPVVKSQPAAIDGSLGIYAGGDKTVFNNIVKDILLCMGSNVIYLGENGAGLVMKICHNMLVGQIQNAVNEVITLAHNQNINTTDFVEAISYGGGDNFYMKAKWSNIDQNEYPAAFTVKNMHKDVHIAQQIAQQAGLQLPSINRVVEVYDKAMERGLGGEDFSATFKVVSKQV